MTKADLILKISDKTGVEKIIVKSVVEALMNEMKDVMSRGTNIYLRGFGSFIVKKRAKKTARNISRNTTMIIPSHYVPTFRPADSFINVVKNGVPVKK